MDHALLARFLPRFVATARERLQRSLQLIRATDADALVKELHALAGEASMLGLTAIAEPARAGENAAIAARESGDRRGLVRVARLIREASKALDGIEAEPPAHDPAGRPQGNGQVLVVDDSPINGEALREALNDAGLSAASALGRQEALEAIAQHSPSVILLDVHIPGEECASLCAALQAAASPRPTVLLVSGMEQGELRALAAEIGADGAVSKTGGLSPIVARACQAASR